MTPLDLLAKHFGEMRRLPYIRRWLTYFWSMARMSIEG